jgi:branched-chain amino acid transport system ATP-binding protein
MVLRRRVRREAAMGGHESDVPLIATRDLAAGYNSVPVVRDLNLRVSAGQIVALLGANGAGKTTTVLSMAGELKPISGAVYSNGARETAALHVRARTGLAYIGEERSIFMAMTVSENLRVARADAAVAYELFPELEKLRSRRAGLLSGGEQQMLALARSLGRKPQLILADELSLGLGPLVVDRLLVALRDAADGVTGGRRPGILLVEQHAQKAVRYADYVYVLRDGRVALEGRASEIRGRIGEVQELYLSSTRAARSVSTRRPADEL